VTFLLRTFTSLVYAHTGRTQSQPNSPASWTRYTPLCWQALGIKVMSEITGILGTLFGVLFGGLIALFTVRQKINHETRAISDKRKVEKIEDAYRVLTSIQYEYQGFNSDDLRRNIEKKVTGFTEEDRVPFAELEMLLCLYVPELAHLARELQTECQDNYFPHMIRLLMCDGEDKEKLKRLKSLNNNENKKVLDKISMIKSQLSSHIRKYAG
jgi:hypothetical protein